MGVEILSDKKENFERPTAYSEVDDMLEDDGPQLRLFPDFLPRSTASATESTGLVQVGMATEDVQKEYDDLYSYRQTEVFENDPKERI